MRSDNTNVFIVLVIVTECVGGVLVTVQDVLCQYSAVKCSVAKH